MRTPATLIADLRSIIEPSHVRTDPQTCDHYGRDWTRSFIPNPLAVVFPVIVEQVRKLVRYANARQLALVPSGGHTGLSGVAVACHGEKERNGIEVDHRLLLFTDHRQLHSLTRPGVHESLR